jgi:hypothetical protein
VVPVLVVVAVREIYINKLSTSQLWLYIFLTGGGGDRQFGGDPSCPGGQTGGGCERNWEGNKF